MAPSGATFVIRFETPPSPPRGAQSQNRVKMAPRSRGKRAGDNGDNRRECDDVDDVDDEDDGGDDDDDDKADVDGDWKERINSIKPVLPTGDIMVTAQYPPFFCFSPRAREFFSPFLIVFVEFFFSEMSIWFFNFFFSLSSLFLFLLPFRG